MRREHFILQMVRTPGVEPGLVGWEPTVITTRPCPRDSSETVVVIERLGEKQVMLH